VDRSRREEGAREVEVDVLHLTVFLQLERPGDLFQARNSLERVALGGLSLHAVPLPTTGLAGLRSLSLNHVDVTDEAVRGILASRGGPRWHSRHRRGGFLLFVRSEESIPRRG
jgi:hypothetical protein